MRLQRPVLLTIVVAAIVAGVALAGGWVALRPGGPPLMEASISPQALSPNGDGEGDAVSIHYKLRRPASVSIAFIDSAGQTFYFREAKQRDAGDFRIDFNGVVDPYSLPGESLPGEVLARVLQNGNYTWVIEANDGQGGQNKLSGPLTVSEADTALPVLSNFTIYPPVFTPNQDGIDDRVTINLALDKTIPDSGLKVFLIGPDNTSRVPIAEQVSALKGGEQGLHTFDYDGGIDLGVDPPPNGTYTVQAVAQDALGQQMAVESQLTIADGGLPRAEITLGEVKFSGTSFVAGQPLEFRLVVENYGNAPIRTTGPFSGYGYDSMSTNYNTIGDYEQAGPWRIGIHCQTCGTDYPWRWALGTPESLTLIPDSLGRPQYYLMPGQSTVITGTIVLDKVVPSLNPQFFWAGLIHEEVELVNDRVDAQEITIVQP